ncbi:MAG: Rne/Rng family ribonuclease [Bacteroidota bacterium]
MSQELIINSTQGGAVTIALLREKKLVELHQESGSNGFLVGDVYLGTVNKLMPGLNAAFVDVGHERDAFLHYLDLGKQVKSLSKFTKLVRNGKPDSIIRNEDLDEDIEKNGKVGQVLNRFQQVVVQVAKEPIANKGPRLTSEISLAGRFLVLMPFDEGINISKKISKPDERTRLKKLVQSLKPKNFAVILRTNAEGASEEDLIKDMADLIERWEHLYTQLKTATPPQKILGESERTLTLIRDLVNEDYSAIHVNDSFLFSEIKGYLKAKEPELEKIVKLYAGKQPIFENFDIDKQIKTSFGKEINFYGGCYLIIEHTEALHVIDVNSGNIAGKEINQEENALKVNLEAATEIARQLRLRDMGGIIVIDFIDLKNPGNRRQVYERLKEEMDNDKAKHKILPMSPFGLVQITRQRVRPEMAIQTTEKCPTCKGTGEIQNTVSMVDEIETRVKYLIENMHISNFTLEIHPYMAAYLKQGILNSTRVKWYFKYKKWIKIKAVQSMHMVEYRFINNSGEEIHV